MVSHRRRTPIAFRDAFNFHTYLVFPEFRFLDDVSQRSLASTNEYESYRCHCLSQVLAQDELGQSLQVCRHCQCMDTTTSHLEAIFRVKNGRPVVVAAELAELLCCRPYGARRKRMCAVRRNWYFKQASNECIHSYATEEGMV